MHFGGRGFLLSRRFQIKPQRIEIHYKNRLHDFLCFYAICWNAVQLFDDIHIMYNVYGWTSWMSVDASVDASVDCRYNCELPIQRNSYLKNCQFSLYLFTLVSWFGMLHAACLSSRSFRIKINIHEMCLPFYIMCFFFVLSSHPVILSQFGRNSIETLNKSEGKRRIEINARLKTKIVVNISNNVYIHRFNK